jgi:hypothetical protein
VINCFSHDVSHNRFGGSGERLSPKKSHLAAVGKVPWSFFSAASGNKPT